MTESQLLEAILGVACFLVLMHGFNTGRGFT